jgi:hypothetical protein
MTNEEKEEKTRDLLLEEIKMLDSMIDEVEDQLAQVGGNLRKLRVVREALQHVTGEQTELDWQRSSHRQVSPSQSFLFILPLRRAFSAHK